MTLHPSSARVLVIGLAPAAVDFSHSPIDRETLEKRVAAGRASVAAAGYDAVSCDTETDPIAGEARVREWLARGPWVAVVIGAGIRTMPGNTELFERIVNAVHELTPSTRFAFNAGPDTTLDALRRVVPLVQRR